jgi:putative spermidine/putrescine transport system substrate-binding protein
MHSLGNAAPNTLEMWMLMKGTSCEQTNPARSLRNHRPSLRKAAALVALLTTAPVVLAGCGSDGDGAGSDLTYTSYGGDYQKAQSAAWVEPFAKSEGISVVQDEPTDYAKIKAMVDSGKVSWDVVDTEPFFPIGNCGTYAEKLDFSVIDTSHMPEGTYSDCAVPAEMFSLVMVYNTEKYPNPPTSLADFFNTADFPGTRVVPGFASGGAIEAALLGDGVSPEDLYPVDYSRAFDKLDSLGDDLTFWNSSAESQEAIESGRADMALVWSGRAYEAKKNGAPIEPVWNDALITYATFMIPKGAPNKDRAMDFIAYAVGAEPQADFAERIPYAPINDEAEPDLDPLADEYNVARPEIQDVAVYQDGQWWADNQDEATEKWTAWSVG